jgi:queuine tRNA-ribosyltransferase
MTLSFEVTATHGAARTGTLRTARGEVPTPCFMPVGTRGAVRHLSSADLEDLGAKIVLGNTYHLMLKPGADLIAQHGGLHGFQDWSGHVLTDSGGYQIFSLDPGGNVKVDDDGVTFRSTYDGGTHRLTPESAVAVQTAFGSDIQMVLDVCAPLPSPDRVLRQAVDRTAVWAGRAREAFLAQGRPELNQFGIVQGGTDVALRIESAERTIAVGFDGYAIGGLSVGESRDAMLTTLAAVLPTLPADQPRYLMGLGDPIGIVEAVALGIDLFDCVLPTRFARHGTILSSSGRYNLKRAENAVDQGPLDDACGCPVCGRWSRSYLRHLLVVDEPTAPRLLTLHNVWWTLHLVDEVRAAIQDGTLDGVRSRIAAAYG